MAHYHMRRYSIFIGDSGGLITEITWKTVNLEVICEWCCRTKGKKLYTLISIFYEKKKDFVPVQIGFRSFLAKYENYLPI